MFDSSPPELSGAASGINNAAARAGGLLAVAALGLAFGGAEASSLAPDALERAYRIVMLAAAVLAGASAAVAAATITPRRRESEDGQPDEYRARLLSRKGACR